MMKKSPDATIDSARQSLQERMHDLQVRYGVKSLGILGSYVHGQQKNGAILTC
jgi:predicted nucleotidyltransferase